MSEEIVDPRKMTLREIRVTLAQLLDYLDLDVVRNKKKRTLKFIKGGR